MLVSMVPIYPAVEVVPDDDIRYAASKFMLLCLLKQKGFDPMPNFVEYPRNEDFGDYLTVTFYESHIISSLQCFVVLDKAQEIIRRAYLYQYDQGILHPDTLKAELIDIMSNSLLYQIIDQGNTVHSFFGIKRV